jgi:signal transduction histidine kinase
MERLSPGRRFVVVAPIGRDAELICGLLNASGYAAEPLSSLQPAEQIPIAHLLGLILAAEALPKGGLEALRRIVQAQPSWSDIPVILLTNGSGEPAYSAMTREACSEIRSVLLLDRPLRMELLLSAVQAASKARLQQLKIRDAVERQVKSDAALRNSEKLAATGRLVATMAHEVSNPLAALNNLLYLVEISNSLDEAQSFGRLAARELGRISEIVDHTLHFNRAATQPADTDLSEIASSALSLFRGKMKERNVTANVAAKRAPAFCSPGEIRQALVNLIGNAIDAMPTGGRIWLRVSRATIKGHEFARITIADNGNGIPREIRANLFTQFFTTKGSGGTGLGLWLTRDIVARNGGKLHMRSSTQPPSGTVFVIYLPAIAGGGQMQSIASASRSMSVAASPVC